ncbi:MAG: amino acid-binding protein [Clostridiales bacterium 43-6]|nr:MAG: amino acid-binding protein [Clostridiales bacterium 43-6]
MEQTNLILVDKTVLPDVYSKVLAAKTMLTNGVVKSSSDAARAVGISRSAFYKYKDFVFGYNDKAGGRILSFHAVLSDTPGVLSSLIGELYKAGANILTLNQNIPIGGAASVSVSIRTDGLRMTAGELLGNILSLNGVLTIEEISGA